AIHSLVAPRRGVARTERAERRPAVHIETATRTGCDSAADARGRARARTRPLPARYLASFIGGIVTTDDGSAGNAAAQSGASATDATTAAVDVSETRHVSAGVMWTSG